MKNELTTKKLCGIAVLIALYAILGAMINIPIIGAISLDLGYLALVVGCLRYYEWGAAVGAVGCGVESILFSPYGFSLSWFVGNFIVGLGCGYVFRKISATWKKILAIIIFVALGILLAKTLIECALFNIPFAVKIVKNFVAFLLDAGTMIVGLFVYNRFNKPAIA